MKKVLFFDDEPSITNYLVMNLRDNYGWKGEKEITFVSTVEDLLNEINKNDVTFDLFVLDVMVPMPSEELKKQFSQNELDKMDSGRRLGFVMAEKIRRIDKYKSVPVLYLSARINSPIPDSERDYTFYLRKPVSAGEITQKMEDLLKLH